MLWQRDGSREASKESFKSGDRKYRKRTTEEKIHYLEMVDWKGAKILL